MLADEIARAPREVPGNVNRALSLDRTDDIRHRILRRNRQHEVDVVAQQMPLLHLALATLGQTPKHVPEVPAQLAVDRLLPILRDEHHVIRTRPLRVV
jgi:hypothetical protein